MPNWCMNDLVLKHKDPAMIDRAVAALKEGKFLNEFIPMPPELLESEEWYGWAVNNWGTKWDVDGEVLERDDPNTLYTKFDSAWSPPIQAYGRLIELGFEIEAYYNEPGMAFCGSYTGAGDEEFDDYIEYSGWSADKVRTEIPELDERFCISEWLEECQENLEEEE